MARLEIWNGDCEKEEYKSLTEFRNRIQELCDIDCDDFIMEGIHTSPGNYPGIVVMIHSRNSATVSFKLKGK